MWIHILVFILLPALWLGGRGGLIPFKKYMSQKEYRRFLLILLLGNLIGLALTLKNNQNLLLPSGSALPRPDYGMGNDSKHLLVDTDTVKNFPIILDIPQQKGDKDSEKDDIEEQLTPQETLIRKIQNAAAAKNQANPHPLKYYLPREADGIPLRFSYPRDNSGSVLLGLSVFCAFLLIIAKEREKERLRQRRLDQLVLDYPNLVTKLALLVQSGMTIRRAFAKTALDYRKFSQPKDVPRPAYEELLVTYYEMEGGLSEANAYENFGRRCNQAQYRTLSTLLCQHLKKGGRGLTDMLERESLAAFEDRKRRAKIMGETAAAKLLIPMVLMLLVVLIILIVPACFSFYS